MTYLPEHPNFINIRYLQRRFPEIAWYFLICALSISRVTTVDNATAPAMVPSTMPTNAPLLKPKLGGLVFSVTLVKTMSTKKWKLSTIILSYMNTWKKRRPEWWIWSGLLDKYRRMKGNLIAQKITNHLEQRIAVINLCDRSSSANVYVTLEGLSST